MDSPVTFPPRPRQAGHKPVLLRIVYARHDDRDRAGRRHGRPDTRDPMRHNDVYLEADQLGRKRRKALEFELCPADLHSNVLAFHVAKLA
jgi:hypothetical protein